MTRHALAPALVMLLAGALALGACGTHPAASPSDPVLSHDFWQRFVS